MKKDNNSLNFCGIYEIFGGIVGLTTLLFINYDNLNPTKVISITLSFILFLLSIYCGYLLIKGEILKGINLSILNNLLQVFGFGVLGFVFKFVSGISLGIKVDLTNDTILGLNFDISNLHLNLNGSSEFTFISLNFIAIFIVRFLLNKKEGLK